MLSEKTIEQRLRRTLKKHGLELHKTRRKLPTESKWYCYTITDGLHASDDTTAMTLWHVIDLAERLEEG